MPEHDLRLYCFRYNRSMRSADLLIAGRRRAGLTQEQLGKRLDRPQSTIARWETGRQRPSLETLIEALHACDLELTVGLPNFDDSYDAQIARQLRLAPADRVAHLAPPWVADGFDVLALLARLAGHARFVVTGAVAAALQGWPILLERRVLEIVPAASSMPRVEQFAARQHADPTADGVDGARHWVLPSGGELRATVAPSGTRGYADLARDAREMEIAPDRTVPVASVIDLIRIAESSPDPEARLFRPALWATLGAQQRKQEAESR
jgi:transcriptional regulator with XRE-family HTH domain